jgi:prepilin-type N-terminal cleavage/methylation domain-containing protein
MAGIRPLGKEGFSLIEVLVSLVILAVGLLSLAMFQITAIKGNAIASRWSVATQLCQDKLEDFRHASWDCVVSSNAGGFDAGTVPLYANLPGAAGDNVPVSGTAGEAGTTYYRIWRVTNTTGTLKTITVWTCWRDDLSAWHNVMLTTQRADIGGV